MSEAGGRHGDHDCTARVKPEGITSGFTLKSKTTSISARSRTRTYGYTRHHLSPLRRRASLSLPPSRILSLFHVTIDVTIGVAVDVPVDARIVGTVDDAVNITLIYPLALPLM